MEQGHGESAAVCCRATSSERGGYVRHDGDGKVGEEDRRRDSRDRVGIRLESEWSCNPVSPTSRTDTMGSSSRRSAAASFPHASTSTQGNQGASMSSLVAALSLQEDDSSGSDQTHYTAPLRLSTHKSAQRVEQGSSSSSPTREAAWSDGASEVDPQQAREWQRERRRLMRCSSPSSPNVSSMSAQELEVAALRRQVEQLQYLLDKRAREEGGQSEAKTSARGTEDAAGVGSRGRSRTRHHHHHHQHHSRSSSGQQQLTTLPLFHSPATSDRDFGQASQQRGSGSTGRGGSSTWTTTTSSSSAGAGPSRHAHRKASSTAGKSTTSSGRRVVFVDTIKKPHPEEDVKGKQRSVVYMRGHGGSSPVPLAAQQHAASSSSLPSLDAGPSKSGGHGSHSGGLHSKTHQHHHPHHARKAAPTGRHLVSFAVGRRRSSSSTEKERKSSGGSTSRPGSVASGGNGGGRRNNVVVFEREQEKEEEAPRVRVVQRMRVGPGRGVLNVGRKER